MCIYNVIVALYLSKIHLQSMLMHSGHQPLVRRCILAQFRQMFRDKKRVGLHNLGISARCFVERTLRDIGCQMRLFNTEYSNCDDEDWC